MNPLALWQSTLIETGMELHDGAKSLVYYKTICFKDIKFIRQFWNVPFLYICFENTQQLTFKIKF